MYKALSFSEPLYGEDARHWKRYRIMKEMGWTLQEYNSSPAYFIDELWAFIATESKAFADAQEK